MTWVVLLPQHLGPDALPRDTPVIFAEQIDGPAFREVGSRARPDDGDGRLAVGQIAQRQANLRVLGVALDVEAALEQQPLPKGLRAGGSVEPYHCAKKDN